MSKRDDILNKVMSLFALAENGSATEGEILAAVSRAQALMARHNLDMAAVEAARGSEDGKKSRWVYGEYASDPIKFKREKMKCYEQKIISAIMILTGTRCRGSWKDLPKADWIRQVIFCGDKTDANIAAALYNTLQISMYGRAKKLFGTNWSSQHRSFCEGFASAILYQVNNQKEKDNANNEYGIVLADKEQFIDSNFNSLYSHLKASEKSREAVNDNFAFSSGVRIGMNQSLDITHALPEVVR